MTDEHQCKTGKDARELELRVFDAAESARVALIDKRLNDADRLAEVEAALSAHEAKFNEREKAEQQAQTERQLAASAVKDALDEARTTQQKALEATTVASSKALEAAAKAQQEALTTALKSANELELSRIEKVADKVKEVKEAATLALAAAEKASQTYQQTAKETLEAHNGVLKLMASKDATYASKDQLTVLNNQLKDAALVTKEAFDKRHIEDLKRVTDEIQNLRESRAGGAAVQTARDKVSASMLGWAAVGIVFFNVIVAVALHFA